MQAPPEAQEAEEEGGMTMARKIRHGLIDAYGGDLDMALRDASMRLAQLDENLTRLAADNARLKAERHQYESNGFSRGRRRRPMPAPGSIRKERIEPLDVSPHDAPHG